MGHPKGPVLDRIELVANRLEKLLDSGEHREKAQALFEKFKDSMMRTVLQGKSVEELYEETHAAMDEIEEQMKELQ